MRDFIDKLLSAKDKSPDLEQLLKEVYLIRSTVREAITGLKGCTSLTGDIRMELNTSTTCIEELGEITGINLHRPSDHSPYVWCMLNDKFEDDGDGLVLVICGTKWELSSTYIDTQIH